MVQHFITQVHHYSILFAGLLLGIAGVIFQA